jgi:hypothetical protein
MWIWTRTFCRVWQTFQDFIEQIDNNFSIYIYIYIFRYVVFLIIVEKSIEVV